MRHRTVIELEVLHDEEIEAMLNGDQHPLLEVVFKMVEMRTGRCRFGVKLAKREVCSPRRQALVLEGMGYDPARVNISLAQPISGNPRAPVRPSVSLLRLADGIDDDVKTCRLQDEDSTARADLDFLLGSMQQMDQSTMREILGEDLIFHQVDIVHEVMLLIADHGGDCLVSDLPGQTVHVCDPPMRRVAMTPRIKGPRFTLTIWDRNARTHGGKERVAFEFRQDGELIFEGDDLGCSPLHAVDSLDTMRALISFFTTPPEEGSSRDTYTPRQMEFVSEFGEELGIYSLGEDSSPFDWDSYAEVPE